MLQTISRAAQKFLALALISLAFIVSSGTTAYASGNSGNSGGDTHPPVSHVTIEDDIYYPEGFNRDTAKYDKSTKTLTLENYNGGPIEITYAEGDVNVVLKGTNTITATVGVDCGIYSRVGLTISGDGSLTIDSYPDSSDAFDGIEISDDVLIINGGKINININSGWDGRGIRTKNSLVIINDGEIDINAAKPSDQKSGIYSDGVIINDGKLKTNMSIETEIIFAQNNGEFEMTSPKNLTSYGQVIFNGGIANIKTSDMTAILIDPEYDDEELEESIVDLEENYNITLPREKSKFVFNGGDVSLEGSMAAAIVIGITGEIASVDQIIKIAGGTTIEPSLATPKTFILFPADEEDDKPATYAATFGDGTGDITFDEDSETLDHAAKKVHLYKSSVPATGEEEENPNTLDTKIILLATGLLFAIIAEGAVIADLYRRLFGYKEAIATIDEAGSEPSEPETPEPKADQ